MLDIDNLPDCYKVKADWYAAIRYASSRLSDVMDDDILVCYYGDYSELVRTGGGYS